MTPGNRILMRLTLVLRLHQLRISIYVEAEASFREGVNGIEVAAEASFEEQMNNDPRQLDFFEADTGFEVASIVDKFQRGCNWHIGCS